MFVKKCFSCGSSSVNTLKSSNNWKTLHQFCSNCGKDQTKRVLAVKKARQTRHKPRTRTQSSNLSYAIGLVFWAILASFYLLISPATLTYAREPELLENLVNKVPQFVSPVVEHVNKPTTPEEVKAYVKEQATLAGVHVEKVLFIVENESHFNAKAVGDMHLICNNKKSPHYGKPVRARGAWQLTDCWYGHVTDEQAFDVEYSTKLALSIISKSKKDCISQWSTCARWYAR
jgi:hypothetical protein